MMCNIFTLSYSFHFGICFFLSFFSLAISSSRYSSYSSFVCVWIFMCTHDGNVSISVLRVQLPSNPSYLTPAFRSSPVVSAGITLIPNTTLNYVKWNELNRNFCFSFRFLEIEEYFLLLVFSCSSSTMLASWITAYNECEKHRKIMAKIYTNFIMVDATQYWTERIQ